MKVVRGKFYTGPALERGLRILLRNAVPFGVIALLVGAPRFAATEILAALSPDGAPGWVSLGLLLLLDLALVKLAAAAIVYGTIRSIEGHDARIGDCIRTGLALIGPVIAISVLVAIGTSIGYTIVILPGIFLEVIWWVAVPAAVAERLGVDDALRRSRELVRGSFVAVFWLFAIVALSKIAVSGLEAGRLGGLLGAAWAELPGWSAALLVYLLTAAVTAFAAVLAAVSYHDLRVAKDGVSTQDIAAVFD